MENVVTFAFTAFILIFVFVLSMNGLLDAIFQTGSALKQLDFRSLYVASERNGSFHQYEIYITQGLNGDLNIINTGFSDLFYLRLVCWEKNNPWDTVTLIRGEVNDSKTVSVSVLSTLDPYNLVEYNLLNHFSNTSNLSCVLGTRHFVKGFVPHG